MKKFQVSIPMPVFVTIELDAENQEDAIEQALQDCSLQTFFGGNCDHENGRYKLVGVSESNHWIEAGDDPMTDGGFSIEAVEVSDE